MTSRRFLWAPLGLWAAVVGWSFLALTLAAPAVAGFTRGLNRVAGFLGWQIGAMPATEG